MKKSILLSFSLLSFAAGTNAQQFLNGSLEPTGTITPCHSVSKTVFGQNMGNVFIAGVSDTGTYMVDNSCGMGSAAAGSHYIGTTWGATTGSPYIVFKLDAPMVAGHQYSYSFSFKAGSPNVTSFIVGTTTDSSQHTSLGHAIGVPSSTTSWTSITDTITAPVATKFFFVVGGTAGSPGTMYIDNFKMLNVVSQGIEEVNNDPQISIYPNPISNTSTISLSNNIALPCKMEMYDLSGRMVMKQNISDRTVPITKGDLNAGLYFIRLQDANKNTFSLKTSIQ